MNSELFREWLTTRNLTPDALSDCISRCRRVEKGQNIDLDVVDFQTLIDNDDDFEEIVTEGKRKNIVADLKSALRKYSMYLLTKENGPDAQTESQTLANGNRMFTTITYSRATLERRFLGRLRTQDRLYKSAEIVYWPRFFSKYFPWYLPILRKEIDDQIICNVRANQEESTVPLAEISSLKFFLDGDNYKACISRANADLNLLSDHEELQVPAKDDPLSQVSLDHIRPISEILSEMQAQLPILRRIYRFLSEKGHVADYAKSMRDTSIQRQAFEIIENSEELRLEIEGIHRKIRLQLMSVSHNSRKGNRSGATKQS